MLLTLILQPPPILILSPSIDMPVLEAMAASPVAVCVIPDISMAVVEAIKSWFMIAASIVAVQVNAYQAG